MAAEEYMIIMSACIPTLTPLFNIVNCSDERRLQIKSLWASTPKASYRHPFRSTSYAQFASDAPEYPLRNYHGEAWATASSKRSERDSDDAEQGIRIMKTTEVDVHTDEENWPCK